MGDELVAKLEVLTGRKVVNYQSQILFEPHIVVEMFFFDDTADASQMRGMAADCWAASTPATRRRPSPTPEPGRPASSAAELRSNGSASARPLTACLIVALDSAMPQTGSAGR